MLEKTNFQMLRELNEEFDPKERGFIDGDETLQIQDKLQILERDIIDLRNLRDFTVMFYSRRGETDEETFKNMDKMSAITCVIDNRLWKLGAEV